MEDKGEMRGEWEGRREEEEEETRELERRAIDWEEGVGGGRKEGRGGKEGREEDFCV